MHQKKRREDCKTLKDWLEYAEDHVMSDEERSQQRISFTYGNAKMADDNVTKEMVEKAAKEVDRTITKDLVEARW